MPGLQIANTSWVFAALGAALFYLWLNPDKIKNRGAFKVGFYLYVVAFFAILFFALLHAGAKGERAEKMIGALLNGISWLMAGVVTLSLFLSLPPLPTLARAARPAREREPEVDVADDEDEVDLEEEEAGAAPPPPPPGPPTMDIPDAPGAAGKKKPPTMDIPDAPGAASEKKPARRRSSRVDRAKGKSSGSSGAIDAAKKPRLRRKPKADAEE